MLIFQKNQTLYFKPRLLAYLFNPERSPNQSEKEKSEKEKSAETNSHVPPIPVYETELLESPTYDDKDNESDKKKKETPKTDKSPEKDEKASKDQDLKLPERPKNAMNGTQFSDYLKNLEVTMEKRGVSSEKIRIRREQEIYRQVISGNIPESMRQLKTVKFKTNDAQGKDVEAEIKVMPDYLSIGSDKDAVRVPMTAATAQLIASHLNCSLPTDKIVDKIAEEAKRSGVILNPQSKPPTDQMSSTQYFIDHNTTINNQLSSLGILPGTLIAGDKKDIVLPKYNEGQRNVAIYGWHSPNLSLIQGYSNGQNKGPHEASYQDYSHGVRLISRNVKITYPDGHTDNMDIDNVLSDNNLFKALSNQRFTQEARNSYSNVPFEHEAVQLNIQATTTNQGAQATESPTGKDTQPTQSETQPSTALPKPSETQTPPADAQPAASQTQPSLAPQQPPSKTQPSPIQAAPSSSTTSRLPQRISTSPTVAPPSEHTPQPPTADTSDTTPPTADTSDTTPPTIDTSTVELPTIQGSVTLVGDSLLSGLKNQSTLKTTGEKKEVAKPGITTKQLLATIEDQSNIEKVTGTDNVVVLIGTNDIGASGPDYTAEAIFDRINQIWQKIKENNADATIVACTIPPFKGHNYGLYGSNFAEVNNKRKEINERIKNSSNPPDKIIDLCQTYANGGLASSEDQDEATLDPNIRQSNNDPVHPSQSAIAELIQRNLTDTAVDEPLTSTKRLTQPQRAPQNTATTPPTPSVATAPISTTTTPIKSAPPQAPHHETSAPTSDLKPIETTLLEDESPEESDNSSASNESAKQLNPERSQYSQTLHVTSVSMENPQDIAPAGFRRTSSVTPAVAQMASTILAQNNPKGTVTYFEVDGKRYAAKDTTHQHAATDNVPDTLKRPHHGVTIFVQDQA